MQALEFVFLPLLAAAVATAFFLLYRFRRAVSAYRKRCQHHPEREVPTAGSLIQEVVGRDELCQMLMENAHVSRTPSLVVGGVGSGKTAVLVRLTELLAAHGAVPVVLALRESQERGQLDFGRLALEAFKRRVSREPLAPGDVEKAWQQLRAEGRAVVLADGLEDALIDTTKVEDRESVIQTAIQQAADSNLPLVVTSRQQAPLRAIDAPITPLDPIGEGAALDYLTRDAADSDRRLLASLVQAAEVAESPLYLRLIHDLATRDRLHQLAPEHDVLRQLARGFEAEFRQGQPVDRAAIRLRLLDSWRRSLIDGHLREDYALPARRRQRTLEVLGALACVGLAQDRAEVAFIDLVGVKPADPKNWHRSSVASRLIRELDALDRHAVVAATSDGPWTWDRLYDEVELAAQYGSALGVVSQQGRAVKFHHSTIQSYLGTTYLHAILDATTQHDGTTLRDMALDTCGRDLLVAVVLHSRLPSRRGSGCAAEGSPGSERRAHDHQGGQLRWWEELTKHVRSLTSDPVTQLRVWAAVAEIEAHPVPDTCRRGGARDLWAKVKQLAGETEAIDPAGLWLRVLVEKWEQKRFRQPDIQHRPLLEAKAELLQRIGATARIRAEPAAAADAAGITGTARTRARSVCDDPVREPTQWLNYSLLYRIAVAENDTAIQLVAAREIAHGGDHAFDDLQQAFGEWWRWWASHWTEWRPFFADAESGTAAGVGPLIEKMEHQWRRGLVCAWLAPMLFYHSVRVIPERVRTSLPAGNPEPGSAFENLNWWITDYLARTDPVYPEKRPWISLEVALARGFREAANHRPLRTVADSRRRAALLEQAEAALRHTRFWYAQLILIQALTLLALPELPGERIRHPGHTSDPGQLVAYWVSIAGIGFAELVHRAGHVSHPFVRETAKLCERALLTEQPASYLWIDEAQAVSTVGSLQRPGKLHEHRLWILPSSGWAALIAEAQALLGDVMIMLNLATRGGSPAEREDRLSRADRPDLPPCFTRDPSALDVNRTVGSPEVHNPGWNCFSDCLFRLCPYPPIGEPRFQNELPEGFCRQLGRTGRITLSYHESISRSRRSQFWEAMATRARPGKGRIQQPVTRAAGTTSTSQRSR